MAIISIVVAIVAYFVDQSFIGWINNPNVLWQQLNVSTFLMIVMFGMGLTVKPKDFVVVFSRPKQIVIGELAQFLIMPLLGFGLSIVFSLPIELAVGVILVGCCPGGTSSNVMSFMAKADVPLSIGLTCVSTALAPILTPILTSFYITIYQHQDTTIDVDEVGMFLGILKIVIVPIVLGMLVNRFFPNLSKRVIQYLPGISCIAICLIIGYVIDANTEKLFDNGLLIFVVVVLHNILGYLLGYTLAKICKFDLDKSHTLALEVGMQNSGMATTLAQSFFATLPATTLPGAIFSTWHNVSGALVATWMAKRKERISKQSSKINS